MHHISFDDGVSALLFFHKKISSNKKYKNNCNIIYLKSVVGG